MFQNRLLSTLFLLMPALCYSQSLSISSVSMKKQKNMARWEIPGANYSGITHIEGNRYAVVSDNERGRGFYLFDISIDSVKGKISDVCLLSRPAVPEGNKGRAVDTEDLAFVPSRKTVFMADEGRQKILEYGLDGQLTGRELRVPSYLSFDSIYPNYGFESLTYSTYDHLLWTTTEHTLRKDGKRSDYSNRECCLLRLQSFSPETCEPISSHFYKTDAPTAKKRGRNYAFGVSAITALDDGTLLLMEREFYVAKKYLGSWVRIKIYRVDLKKKSSDGCLQKELVVSFKNRLNLLSRNIANYEGMCLGPKLSDGRQAILLLADSQNNHGNSLFHLKDYIRILRIDFASATF